MTDIRKADGSVEAFDPAKLESSLMHAGAGENTAHRISEKVERNLTSGVGTHEIYRRAFALLRQETRAGAARYSLRRALFEFGPSGHPFEDFIAALFKKEGWNVEWRKTIPGQCVAHEVDIYASREQAAGKEYLAAELKYHNDPNYKTDLKIALYVKARFDDIWKCDPAISATCPVDHGFLITNTKFTSAAIQYAECSGIGLLGWSYPRVGNLYDRIVSAQIYPVTALTTLKKAEKNLLIEAGIVTTEELKEKREMLRTISVPPWRIGPIIAEIEALHAPIG